MNRDYFQDALHKFNLDTPNWYNWKTHDDNGNKIPNDQRMQYQHIKIIKDGATIPSEADVNAKIQELKDAETETENLKASAKTKLIAGEALTAEEADTIVL
tara:strand:+ start:206 stop:508 length:303 start_codon:yes stop_codon:yes gene_type:complete